MYYKQNLERYLILRIDALNSRLRSVEPSARYYVQDQIDELKFIRAHLNDF